MGSFGKREEQGSILVAVLIITAALLILCAALLDLSLNERKITAHQERGLGLYYLAEAGLEAGLAALNVDYRFAGPLGGYLDRGSYLVEIAPLPDNRRLLSSTGYLDHRSLTMTAEAGLDPRFEKALLVTDHLAIADGEIYGSIHVDRELLIKGSNRIDGTDVAKGLLSYSEEPPRFAHPHANIMINEQLYTANTPFDRETMRVPPVGLPDLNFEALGEGVQCHLEPAAQTLTWAAPPACYPEQNQIQVTGNLLIAPEEGGEFNFCGLLIIRGDLEIQSGRGGVVNISGRVLVEGDLLIDGDIHPGSRGGPLILAAAGDISIVNFENRPLGGGPLLLWAGGEVGIEPAIPGGFEMEGAIMGKRLVLEGCSLLFDPEVLLNIRDLWPGSGAFIIEWIRPRSD